MIRHHKPDTKCFCAVITAWTRSGIDDAPEKAEAILRWMFSIGVRPDTVCFNAVITGYARSGHQMRRKKALGVFRQMKEKRVSTSSVTYSLLFEVCVDSPYISERASDEEWEELFRECTNDGVLDGRIFHELRSHGPKSVQHQLDTTPIPQAWSRNAGRGSSSLSQHAVNKMQERTASKRKAGIEVDGWGWGGKQR